MKIQHDEKVQVAVVLTIAAALTAIMMFALWWSCGFGSISACMYGIQAITQ